jgi:ubiquinone/menaquinone biosynthesis C-methylase UbiE
MDTMTIQPAASPAARNRALLDWLAAARESLGGPQPSSTEEAYDRAAPVYGALHWCWLRLAGGSAERRLLEEIAARATHGSDVLDAGCGLGRLARRIAYLRPSARLTMVDISAAMLTLAGDVPGEHICASVLDLPFADNRFQTVVSAWVLETLNDPDRALEEYARVAAPGAHLVYCFSSLPATRLGRFVSAPTRSIVERRFAGSFLPRDPLVPKGCRELLRFKSRGQLATTVVLRKLPDGER